jgi:ABC-2 type transport system permease protein
MAIATILPSVFFSGIIFPLETMPWIFRAISTVVPLTYFARVLRGVTLRGATFADLELDLIILAVMGVLLVALATRRFRTEMAK